MQRIAKDPALASLWRGEKVGGDTTSSGLDWSLAQALGRAGIASDEIARALRQYPHGQIGRGKLSGRAAARRIAQLLEAAQGAAAPAGAYSLSDDGLALSMGSEWAAKARHVALWGKWLFWNGWKWELDEKLLHMTLTREFLRRIAAAFPKPGKALGDARVVARVVSLARSNPELASSSSDWDADPWLLNTPGGIVDLRTGIMRPPDPAALCTKSRAENSGHDLALEAVGGCEQRGEQGHHA